jgi:hypothetical protein
MKIIKLIVAFCLVAGTAEVAFASCKGGSCSMRKGAPQSQRRVSRTLPRPKKQAQAVAGNDCKGNPTRCRGLASNIIANGGDLSQAYMIMAQGGDYARATTGKSKGNKREAQNSLKDVARQTLMMQYGDSADDANAFLSANNPEDVFAYLSIVNSVDPMSGASLDADGQQNALANIPQDIVNAFQGMTVMTSPVSRAISMSVPEGQGYEEGLMGYESTFPEPTKAPGLSEGLMGGEEMYY